MVDLLQLMTEDSQAEIKRQAMRRKLCVEKWDSKTMLLRGLKESAKGNLAVMLDNEAQALNNMLQEASYAASVAGFSKIAFPLVRRVFANLIADKIISIQPMSLPAGLLFYLDFKHDTNTTKAPYTGGESVYGALDFKGNTVLEGMGAQLPQGSFYGLNASYGYRIFHSGSISATTQATPSLSGSVIGTFTDEDGLSKTAQKYTFAFGSKITAVDLANLRQFAIVPSNTITEDTGAAYKTFQGVKTTSSAGLPILKGETTLSSVVLTNNIISSGSIDVWSLSGSFIGGTDPTGYELVFIAATDLDNRAEFEAVGQIPEINLEIKKVNVNTQTRKLKTKWTPEIAQDINAYMGLDAEVELTKILSEQCIIDIDREIVSDLIAGAYFKDVWSRKIGKYIHLDANNHIVAQTTDSDILGFGNGSNGAGPVFKGTQKEWYQTLIEKINKVAYKIFKATLRGKANFIVTSTAIASMLESTEEYVMDIAAGNIPSSVGIIKSGSLQNKYNIYIDPYLPDGIMLIGFKGSSFLETGFVYAPYVPLVGTPTLMDPEDFTPRKGIMTRYGKQMVRNDFYGVIYVLDLDLF